MTIHKLLENPRIYNLSQRVLSIIAFGNKGIGNFLKAELGNSPDTVLDVGCGTGRYADIFGKRYTGIDPNGEYIDHARANYSGNFIVADCANLQKAGKQFDTVLCINTFHHLNNEQIRDTVKEMKTVAEKNIYIIDPVYPIWLNLLGYLLFKMDRGEYQRTYQEHEFLLNTLGFKLKTKKLKNSFPYQVTVFKFSH